ncbi:hydroxymethylglutaryl-CoA lyase [Alicyclobacillus tolerans]|uniref:hydroxymethylglutaryl-CoA lyase n=1 Tax=Alicyclobacillus tolerans TaxID=90970 RepID=UPI001F21D08F|nr:hydroxymethylglutaryl-CoA lyase [Alicyclobacillus tolerans]MCF8567341.1 hydroxymethylglutaryl-CoA lyase [Alicyclobacillus tolerans]
MESNRVWIRDVAPRDGFQIEPQFVPLDVKVETINALAKAGVPSIEATSFVHPKAVPQMADAAEVMTRIERYPGTTYAVLVPNLVGAKRALECNPDQINLVVSASESHNRANLNRETFETLDGFRDIASLIRGSGVDLHGGIATSFGCPFEGSVPVERVLRVVERYLELGVTAVGLADTTGMANPRQVQEIVEAVQKRWPDLEVHLHFHNTRGMGLANVFAGYLSGIRHFDASLGGIGGCPFAPGATGNICTEDTVHMLHEMGIETQINLDALISAAKRLEKQLGHSLPGQVMKAGKTSDLHPLPSAMQYEKTE